MTEPKYKSTLNGQRAADSEIVEKFRETAAKFASDQKIILALLNELSMSTKAEDKAILPLVQILYQNLARTEDLGGIFNLQARICNDIVTVIYIHLNDIDRRIEEAKARIFELEDKHTAKYFFSKAKVLGATIQFLAATGTAIVAIMLMFDKVPWGN
jgi:hypothetical protein